MPINIGETLAAGCDCVFDSLGLNSTFASTISTAIVISVLMCVLVAVFIDHARVPAWMLGKFAIYAFLVTSLVLFAHASLVHARYRKKPAETFESLGMFHKTTVEPFRVAGGSAHAELDNARDLEEIEHAVGAGVSADHGMY